MADGAVAWKFYLLHEMLLYHLVGLAVVIKVGIDTDADTNVNVDQRYFFLKDAKVDYFSKLDTDCTGLGTSINLQSFSRV